MPGQSVAATPSRRPVSVRPMFVDRRAARRAVASYVRERRSPVAIAVVLASTLVMIATGVVVSAGDQGSIRLVLAAPGHGERALALSRSSIYARNDPWKEYLASESICPGGEETAHSVEEQVATLACLVNYARKRRGLEPLIVRVLLNGASSAKAEAIIRCRDFSHAPCGGRWAADIRSSGYVGAIGENLYIGSGQWGAPRVAVDAWLNSPEHRENLFSSEFRGQGLALLKKARFGDYRNVSLWVNAFADR
jgi:uncharacterized protein YkwD